MTNDESDMTTGAPYRDTPQVVPDNRRMPVSDPNANTAASKRSTGARDGARGASDQRQGDTGTYEDALQSQWENDLEAESLDRAAAEEAEEDGGR